MNEEQPNRFRSSLIYFDNILLKIFVINYFLITCKQKKLNHLKLNYKHLLININRFQAQDMYYYKVSCH